MEASNNATHKRHYRFLNEGGLMKTLQGLTCGLPFGYSR